MASNLITETDAAKGKLGYGIPVLGWIASVLVAATILAALEIRTLQFRFEESSQALLRALSQRTGQHDVAMTSLSAFASQEGKPINQSVFEPLADNLTRFYPRITGITIAPLNSKETGTFRAGPSAPAPGETLRQRVARQRPGQAFATTDADKASYILAKRSSGKGVSALLLRIDIAKLMQVPFILEPEISRRLVIDGAPLTGSPSPSTKSLSTIWRFGFERRLASQSQPFILQTSRRVALQEALPPVSLSGIAALLGVLWAMGWTLFRQRREALEARKMAELKQYEARLAHASRVNALGELVSGIAHELAQPLTSLLSQTQAGARLARQEPMDREAVASSLETSARIARRAGEILSRLRAYVSNKPLTAQDMDLIQAAREVSALFLRDLQDRGITFRLDAPDNPLMVHAERISIEQIIHNLLRNAMEAIEGSAGPERTISLTLFASKDVARLTVNDTGPGVSEEQAKRLFEPFFTTKPDGMGLGLSLCERLAEDNGGTLTMAASNARGASFCLELPLRSSAIEGA
jgi:two-component system sensor kinase FixL